MKNITVEWEDGTTTVVPWADAERGERLSDDPEEARRMAAVRVATDLRPDAELVCVSGCAR